jgi:hypothetical protein
MTGKIGAGSALSCHPGKSAAGLRTLTAREWLRPPWTHARILLKANQGEAEPDWTGEAGRVISTQQPPGPRCKL